MIPKLMNKNKTLNITINYKENAGNNFNRFFPILTCLFVRVG